MLIQKIWNKILFLLEECGADWQWDWEAEGRIFSSDLKIPLNKMEVVLRNENVWCSQQVERYEEYLKLWSVCPFLCGRVMQLILQSGLKRLWFHSSVLEIIWGKGVKIVGP